MKSNFFKDKKILVTGGSGFLGRHLVNKLKTLDAHVSVPRSGKYDLRQSRDCRRVVHNTDIVIHLAAKVGGIGFNMNCPGKIFYDNILMGVHMMEEARLAGVKKFIAIGTICAYPKFSPLPFKEENLWDGYPEETNAPYGLSKKMLLVQAQAYRKQYGFNCIYLLPVNLYGPGDKFDEKVSHVIPALIKKAIYSKEKGLPEMEVWGTGMATREFLYVEDAAEAIILATENYNSEEPVNIGSGYEISISDLVHLICNLVGYGGKIVWNTSKPDGQPRRKLDIDRAKKGFGFRAKTPFPEGLKKTIDWYLENR
jgi:GDP-L-fucose synthase